MRRAEGELRRSTTRAVLRLMHGLEPEAVREISVSVARSIPLRVQNPERLGFANGSLRVAGILVVAERAGGPRRVRRDDPIVVAIPYGQCEGRPQARDCLNNGVWGPA